MACHGELAQSRPAARHLTGFYVALSFGGMVGGLFAGLIAPYAFSWIAEYPILLALAALCRPAGMPAVRGGLGLWLVAVVAGFVLIGLGYREGTVTAFLETNRVWMVSGFAVVMMVLASSWKIDRWSVAGLVVLGLILIRV